MSGRYFLDTNIFVYSFDRVAASKLRRANQLIRDAVATRKGVVSFQVVQEFLNVAVRRFATPLTIGEAQQYLATVFRPLLAVHSSLALYGEALRVQDRHHLSWYDSLIVASAMEASCGVIYSEDLQNGQKFGDLVVRNPFD